MSVKGTRVPRSLESLQRMVPVVVTRLESSRPLHKGIGPILQGSSEGKTCGSVMSWHSQLSDEGGWLTGGGRNKKQDKNGP